MFREGRAYQLQQQTSIFIILIGCQICSGVEEGTSICLLALHGVLRLPSENSAFAQVEVGRWEHCRVDVISNREDISESLNLYEDRHLVPLLS